MFMLYAAFVLAMAVTLIIGYAARRKGMSEMLDGFVALAVMGFIAVAITTVAGYLVVFATHEYAEEVSVAIVENSDGEYVELDNGQYKFNTEVDGGQKSHVYDAEDLEVILIDDPEDSRIVYHCNNYFTPRWITYPFRWGDGEPDCYDDIDPEVLYVAR